MAKKITGDENKGELYRLIMLIWKWKFLYAAVFIVFIGSVFLYCKTRPVLFGETVRFRVGKIANIQIEPFADIELYCKKYQDAAAEKGIRFGIFPVSQGSTVSDIRGTLVTELVVESSSAELTRAFMETVSADLAQRHRVMFSHAKSAVDKSPSVSSSDRLLYLLDAYTFPSQQVSPASAFTLRALSDRLEYPIGSGMGTKHYLVLAFIAAAFAGLFLIYVCDMYAAYRRGRF